MRFSPVIITWGHPLSCRAPRETDWIRGWILRGESSADDDSKVTVSSRCQGSEWTGSPPGQVAELGTSVRWVAGPGDPEALSVSASPALIGAQFVKQRLHDLFRGPATSRLAY